MKALVPLALALLAAPALANAPVDLPSLDRAVTSFTGVPTGQPGGAAAPLDRPCPPANDLPAVEGLSIENSVGCGNKNEERKHHSF